jgi:hypothetical protein
VESTGRTYTDVGIGRAIGSSTVNASVGDRIALWEDNGQRWALFCLDRVGLSETVEFTPSVSIDGTFPEIFPEGSSLDSSLSISNSSVKDTLPGDEVLSAKGGALLGALVGGVVINKASAWCMTIWNKADDLLKTFTRNWEKHTSASSEVEVHRGTTTYAYKEYYPTMSASKASQPSFIEAYGNTAYAMTYGLSFRADAPAPTSTNIVAMYAVPTKYSCSIHEDGSKVQTLTEGIYEVTRGNDTFMINEEGIILTSETKIKLQVGTTLVELTPEKLKLVADLISENGV